ncbi:MAG: UDP-N-acetylmuramoyl-tripeptide--D-alanyl-D-alanine ligase [Oscillospiraceae bacterium]|nr:UDP-N-acetylmuramoyl-tripeptide--D-alanyl-D-alanine ligase [Oscillospiraceae bacterium]
MAEFTLKEIASAVGGLAINRTGIKDESITISGICTDSRAVEPGNLFVALVGEHFDGHQFCKEVSDKGGKVFLISREACLPEQSVGIIVPDTLKAYQDLAKYRRKRLGCKVIAVTGSVGKTSTREMIALAMASSFRTHVTTANNNNEIGLPSTILAAPEDTEIIVLEMGMRQLGEIRVLTGIAAPDIAVVTNIGVSHIELLGSRESILAAKMEICEGLGPEGILIINGDDPFLSGYVSEPSNRRWRQLAAAAWTAKSCETLQTDFCVHADRMVMSETGTSFDAVIVDDKQTEQTISLRIRATGRHHIKNAMISIMCARFAGVDPESACLALQNYHPMSGRGKIIQTKRFTVCDDAYNASPESMMAAFENVAMISGARRKIAAIGGMLELGGYASELHYEIGAGAAESGIDCIYVCGEFAEKVREGALSVRPGIPVKVFADRDQLTDVLIGDLLPDDVILCKASHSFRFDLVSEAIIRLDGGPISVEKEERS